MSIATQNPLAATMLLFLLVVMIGVAVFRYRIFPYVRSLQSTADPGETHDEAPQ